MREQSVQNQAPYYKTVRRLSKNPVPGHDGKVVSVFAAAAEAFVVVPVAVLILFDDALVLVLLDHCHQWTPAVTLAGVAAAVEPTFKAKKTLNTPKLNTPVKYLLNLRIAFPAGLLPSCTCCNRPACTG